MYAEQPDTTPLSFNQYSVSYYEMADTNQLQVSLAQDGHAIQAFNPMLRNSFRMGGIFPCNGDNSLPLFPDGHFTMEDDCEAQMPIWSTSATPAWGHGSGIILTPHNQSSVGIFTASSPNFVHSRSMGKARDVCPKSGWLKLRAVIQWRSISRGAARRRLRWLPEGICI